MLLWDSRTPRLLKERVFKPVGLMKSCINLKFMKILKGGREIRKPRKRGTKK
jgi:hypothetical protein